MQTVKNLLRASGKDDTRPWDMRLKEAVDAYNAATQASTGFEPARLAFGTIPPLRGLAKGSARRRPFHDMSFKERMAQRALIRETAADNILKAQARQKSYFDRKRKVIRFEPGSLVRMLRNPKKMAKKRKFQLPWIGPLVVVKEKHPDVYSPLPVVFSGKIFSHLRNNHLARVCPASARTIAFFHRANGQGS